MCTYRPGGFDLFCESFNGMESRDGYEVVVVDDYPGRVERGTVSAYFKQRGINLGWYGKSKLKSYPKTKCGLMNAWNTAIMHARGDYLVFLSDYCFLPTYWLELWNHYRKIYGDRTLISGSAILYDTEKPPSPGDVDSWEGTDKFWMLKYPKYPWVAWEWETFLLGASLQFFLDINGCDERADHAHQFPVTSKKKQARILGYELKVVQEACCIMVDHRVWQANGNEPNPLGNEGLWRITDIQSVPEEPMWQVPSPNPFNIMQLRKEVGSEC